MYRWKWSLPHYHNYKWCNIFYTFTSLQEWNNSTLYISNLRISRFPKSNICMLIVFMVNLGMKSFLYFIIAWIRNQFTLNLIQIKLIATKKMTFHVPNASYHTMMCALVINSILTGGYELYQSILGFKTSQFCNVDTGWSSKQSSHYCVRRRWGAGGRGWRRAQMKKAKREKAFDYLLCDPEAKKDTKLKGWSSSPQLLNLPCFHGFNTVL